MAPHSSQTQQQESLQANTHPSHKQRFSVAAFVISNLLWTQTRSSHYSQGKTRTGRQEQERPGGFTEACTCKMYGLTSHVFLSSAVVPSQHPPASWLGCWEKAAVLPLQGYCQLKVLMACSCRTHCALSVPPSLCLFILVTISDCSSPLLSIATVWTLVGMLFPHCWSNTSDIQAKPNKQYLNTSSSEQ